MMNDDSVCFLWTTSSFIKEALSIMGYWGFEYKTMITWVKRNNGLGNWFRGKTEHLLMGVRGKVKPFHLQAPNVIISEKTLKHSEKPQESYSLIQECAWKMTLQQENIHILELFSRKHINLNSLGGAIQWTCIGKEITGNDIKMDLENLRVGTETN